MAKKQKRKSQPKHPELVRVAEYMVSGGAYFWTGYFIIVFLTPVIGLWWANLLGNGVGVTVNFLLQRYWVFSGSKKRKITSVSWRYVVITGFNFVLNYYILRGLLSLGIPVAFGQFGAAGFFTVWNYAWYRWWVFADHSVKPGVRHHA